MQLCAPIDVKFFFNVPIIFLLTLCPFPLCTEWNDVRLRPIPYWYMRKSRGGPGGQITKNMPQTPMANSNNCRTPLPPEKKILDPRMQRL